MPGCRCSFDLRKGVVGLLAIIENEMHLDALSNSVFFFCNKSHRLLKIIFWNKTGFWLAQKRLEMATWPWPHTSQEARKINTEQFEMLLAEALLLLEKMNVRLSERDQKIRKQQAEIKILNEKLAAKTESLKKLYESQPFLFDAEEMGIKIENQCPEITDEE